jgi:hypothetical protein
VSGREKAHGTKLNNLQTRMFARRNCIPDLESIRIRRRIEAKNIRVN